VTAGSWAWGVATEPWDGKTKDHTISNRVGTKRQDTASQDTELRLWAESHQGNSCWYRDPV
jgi:hypothetical protein